MDLEHAMTVYRSQISEDFIMQMLTTLGSALTTMHRQHVVHRDIKPKNVLIKLLGESLSDGVVLKLADFDVSR